MGPLIYKWDPSFINEDIYVSFGTNGTPYTNHKIFFVVVEMSCNRVQSLCCAKYMKKGMNECVLCMQDYTIRKFSSFFSIR